jgi:HK97 family phage prohead protease
MSRNRLNLKLSVKALSDNQFEGYGSTFNNLDLVGDVVAPGAFGKSLDAADRLPLMLWMHDPTMVPGKWLEMEEDRKGLYVKGELADTQLGREAHTLLKMEAVSGLSIGFRTLAADWAEDEERGVFRVLKELDLVEVSIVSMAANPLAEVSAVKTRLSKRGVYVPTRRETESMLMQGGFSRTAAKDMVAKLLGSSGMLDTETREDASSGMLDTVDLSAIDRLTEALKATPAPVIPDVEIPFWRR